MNNKMNPIIKSDILRYKKNKLGANLALLGLAAGCIYFLTLYKQVNNGNYYYTWWIAFDVIYNLFFLLFTFLFSEQVKGYDRSLFPVQMAVGGLQIARIFWLPMCGYLGIAHDGIAKMARGVVIDFGTFFGLSIFLAISGACIIVSGIIGFIRSKEVENFNKKLENGEVDIDATLKELDAQDEAAAASSEEVA